MKSSLPTGPFGLGAVVVPARDGALERLGRDVAALGDRALGVVIEAKPSKALVLFPALKLSIWIPHDEMADVDACADAGDAAYSRLRPNDGETLTPATPLVWWIRGLARNFELTHVLGIEEGPLGEVWPDENSALAAYTACDVNAPVAYVALGIPELKLEDWQRARDWCGPTLLFTRFLPAGMHKMEIAFYLKR